MKKFYLSDKDKKITGVCGGLAEYFNIDSTFVRFIFVLVSLLWGFGIVAYIILWLISPRRPKEAKQEPKAGK